MENIEKLIEEMNGERRYYLILITVLIVLLTMLILVTFISSKTAVIKSKTTITSTTTTIVENHSIGYFGFSVFDVSAEIDEQTRILLKALIYLENFTATYPCLFSKNRLHINDTVVLLCNATPTFYFNISYIAFNITEKETCGIVLL